MRHTHRIEERGGLKVGKEEEGVLSRKQKLVNVLRKSKKEIEQTGQFEWARGDG